MSPSAISVTRVFFFAFHFLLVIGCASSQFPAVSEDSLEKVAQTSFDAVYEAPAFDLEAFGQLDVEECTVQFRDNWLRDQNRNRGPSRRVTADDMKRIEEYLAKSCHQIFSTELEEVALDVDEASSLAGTLDVRPAVVDLDISSPDVQSPGRETSYSAIPVKMSLRLEMVNSVSGQVVVRVIDQRRADNTMSSRQTSSVGNMADAERILRHWAALVRARLETATE